MGMKKNRLHIKRSRQVDKSWGKLHENRSKMGRKFICKLRMLYAKRDLNLASSNLFIGNRTKKFPMQSDRPLFEQDYLPDAYNSPWAPRM